MEELLERLHRALSDRYTFERELGRGGAAVVFLAHDLKHGRDVAFKVLLPQVSLAIGAERFQREITIAARLTHPHILTLHDSGEAGGLLYYVMPFMRGETLRDRLDRKATLDVAEALRIGMEVASALECAHAQGVVHRDIKPENILLEGGYAVVADFGIARARSDAEDSYSTTQTGLAVGTPTYMSPEQTVGARDIDGRSDQYSLACVVYEMLTGAPPFRGASLRELLARHAMDPVPSVRAVRPEVPEYADQAIRRALAKEPSDRFDSASDFAQGLSGAGAPVGGGFWTRLRSVFSAPAATPLPAPRRSAPLQTASDAGGPARAATGSVQRSLSPMPDRRTPILTTPSGRTPIDSLAVLPFTNLGGDADGEYLSDGITESIMNKLTSVAGLRVVPRSVIFRYKEREMDPTVIAREVNARAFVTGRIMHRGETLIIKVELVDTRTESQLWGEQYHRKMADIFEVQEDMASEITRSLRLKLSGEEQAGLAKRFTENSEAYQAYLRGRYHWSKRTLDGLQHALSHFQRAIELDPTYALAYSGLADTYNILGYYNNQPPHDAYPKGRAAAQRALEIDESLAQAHASMGYVQVFYDLDWPGAERSFKRAIELNPKYATAHHWYAWYLFVVERFDQALAEMRVAVELDPLSLIANDHLSYALLLAGRPDEAMAQAQRTRELDPTFPWTYWRMGTVSLSIGRIGDAIASFGTVVEMTGGVVGLGYLGLALAQAGRPDDARAVLTRLDAMVKGHYVSPLEYALVYGGLGEIDRVLDNLEKAYADRVSDFARVKLLPWPDAARAHPRFTALVQRLGSASS